MPTFNPFTSVTGKHAFTLFDIRLDNDFIVFRGTEHESSGQMLKGVVVVCVPGPTKIEDVHLRLVGTLRLSWTDPRATPTGLSNQKFDRTITILDHRWPSFIGTPGKSMMLEKGNYEFPFELMLPGETSESLEGLREASITYRLKATIARGKLAYDHHAYKHVRIIRTLDSSALEFLHAMSVENIWPNKVEYSIVVTQKAIVFGSSVPLETRFTPLLKGLELGGVTIKLVEICEIIVQTPSGVTMKEYKREREVASWVVPISREEHWRDVIEDTGQEGWVMNSYLDLPQKLGKCVQDVNLHGIKTRHKLKIVVALKNPDGHVSELRATLPITIFISPNIPLDEEGNLSRPSQVVTNSETTNRIAPPGYGEHVLDQLYEDVDPSGFQTPGVQSGMNSPYIAGSRAGSSENLAAMLGEGATITPAALSSRLQDMSMSGQFHRDASFLSTASGSGSGGVTPAYSSGRIHGPESSHTTPLHSAPLSRHNSNEDHSGRQSPEHLDFPELPELSKVPSYATAIKSTKVAPLTTETGALPDYFTATSEPTTSAVLSAVASNPLELIPESPHEDLQRVTSSSSTVTNTATPPTSSPTALRSRRPASIGYSLSSYNTHSGDADERRRLHLIQARDRVI